MTEGKGEIVIYDMHNGRAQIEVKIDGPAIEGTAYAKFFTGKYAHEIIPGIGHNVPQEAPQVFADAIIEVDKC